MGSYLDFYLTNMKFGIQEQLQYRVANYLYMIGMVAEPVIYLVVWSTVARSNGGAVGGYTAGTFAAYYIVWTLVRNMNIVFTPFGWEFRIRQGYFSQLLLKPIHPIHYDLSYFAGWKFAVILMWLPVAVALSLVFHPVLHPDALQIVVFFFALWGAYLIRSVVLWLLGMITFWTTRVSAIFDFYMALELILSGRLVPLTLMPHWVQQVSFFLPFQWTFYFPIQALISPHPSDATLLGGLAMQALFVALGGLAVRFAWRASVKRYTAVGN